MTSIFITTEAPFSNVISQLDPLVSPVKEPDAVVVVPKSYVLLLKVIVWLGIT